MKKRLRKKLRLFEFQHTGFAVCLSLNLLNMDEERHLFWAKLEKAIEARGLYVIGRADDFWVFTNYNIVPIPAIKEVNRLWMREWLVKQPEVVSYRISTSGNNWTPCYDYSKAV
jgi:uncharacterized protein YggL (DUF469 family)